MRIKNILYFLIPLALLACEREDPDLDGFQKSTGVFVLNEGNFTYGNASLSFLDLETGEFENQVFFQANGFPLGDVAYSMTIMDSLAFVVINNSGKIFIINTTTFQHEGTISGLTSPRYVSIVDSETGYISDLYANYLLEFNPINFTITDTITTGKSTEQIIYLDDYLYVNNWSFGTDILKIEIKTKEIVGSIRVNKQPNSMVLDKNDQLWVLSDGGFEGSQFGVDYPALAQINPKTLELSQTILFPSLSGSPNNLSINESKDSLYFLYGSWAGETGFNPGIYKMSILDTELPPSALVPEQHHRFYRLGIDPSNSTIYVSDALDYLQKGLVFRYHSDGTLIDSLLSDRVPGFFAFK